MKLSIDLTKNGQHLSTNETQTSRMLSKIFFFKQSQIILNYKNKWDLAIMCGSRKYPYPSHGRDWNFQGGGGSKAQENPEWGGEVLSQFILFFPDQFHYSYNLC